MLTDFPNFDAQTVASQGCAVLGIRDSGKSYTATGLAERFFDAGIPFVAFDPIGIWRFLRVPGAGKGYPVVVAGGAAGDLPLTPGNASAIVRAAMQDGVSLVIDLYDVHMSKADWKRIVADSVKTLLYENGQYGLRHIFIEEAAEFIPQRPGLDQAAVYAEIEKLSRMGGNARLGYTLINQRSEEVAKAVLELCDNLFLHRQKGKNSLLSLAKWLDVGDVKMGKEIVSSLPTLPQGECWAWMGGADSPVLVKVPAKNSFHPDRRTMRSDAIVIEAKAVDTSRFVAELKSKLGQIEVETKANDPKTLKAEIARLKAEIARGKPGKAEIQAAFDNGRQQGLFAGQRAGVDEAAHKRAIVEAHDDGFEKGVLEGKRMSVEALRPIYKSMEDAKDCVDRSVALMGEYAELVGDLRTVKTEPFYSKPILETLDRLAGVSPKASKPHQLPSQGKPVTANGHGATPGGGAGQRIIDGLVELQALGVTTAPRVLAAFMAGYSNIRSKGFANALGTLRTSDCVEYPTSETVYLTGTGRGFAKKTAAALTTTEMQTRIGKLLGGAADRILDAVIGVHPEAIPRETVAAEAGYENVRSKGFANALGRLRTLGFVEYPTRGEVRATDLLFP